MIYDAAIIGAGAAGLMAAGKLAACRPGLSIALLDGNSKAGKKLLATGNGRCNLTNMNLGKSFYHGDDLSRLLTRYDTERILAEFSNIGLLCRTDEAGRVYPRNLQAAAVRQLLRGVCNEKTVDFHFGFKAVSAVKNKDVFTLKSEDGREIRARKLILATGGLAAPKHSAADGYALAAGFGHSCTELFPALAPVHVAGKFTKAVKGMRMRARAALLRGGEVIYSESGEVIFSSGALSGICIFNISSFLADMLRADINAFKAGDVRISLDMAEEFTAEELEAYFHGLAEHRAAIRTIDILSGIVNIKAGEEIIRSLHFDVNLPIEKLNNADIKAIAKAVKQLYFTIERLSDFDSAQVTSGGVPLDEIDGESFESKLCPKLYIIGELLNANGLCGGYNLHLAWATALAAAEGIAASG